MTAPNAMPAICPTLRLFAAAWPLVGGSDPLAKRVIELVDNAVEVVAVILLASVDVIDTDEAVVVRSGALSVLSVPEEVATMLAVSMSLTGKLSAPIR